MQLNLQSLIIGALSFLASTLIFYTVSYVLLLDLLPNHVIIAFIILSALMISFLITRKSMNEPSAKAKVIERDSLSIIIS